MRRRGRGCDPINVNSDKGWDVVNVELFAILRAARRLEGRIVRTPLVYSPVLSAQTGSEVWLKPENWQYTGSFKLRGALNKMAQLSDEDRRRGVITASAGNHAQGVALAGQLLGTSVLVVAPQGTPQTKMDGIRQYGADVLLEGSFYDESEAIAYERARETGRVFVHAFEDAEIVAGQGTVGLEMLEDQPDLDIILVPAGGGGLICGIGVTARAVNPDIKVVGVQSQASPAWHRAWQAGRLVEVDYQETWAEGLLGAIGAKNFELAQRVVDGFELVSEDDIRSAMHWALARHHWVLEGSGAVGLAYALSHAPELKGRRVGIVLTGGNLDMARLGQIISGPDRPLT